MGKNTDKKAGRSRVTYKVLEEVVRMEVQESIQYILEKEITDFFERRKYERMKKINTHSRYWMDTESPGGFHL